MTPEELNDYEDAINGGLDDPQMLRTIVLSLIDEARLLREWSDIMHKKSDNIARSSLDCVVSTENKYKLLLEQGREDHERIVRLEAEAWWLAQNCETLSGYSSLLRQGMSKEQWREEAHKVVGND